MPFRAMALRKRALMLHVRAVVAAHSASSYLTKFELFKSKKKERKNRNLQFELEICHSQVAHEQGLRPMNINRFGITVGGSNIIFLIVHVIALNPSVGEGDQTHVRLGRKPTSSRSWSASSFLFAELVARIWRRANTASEILDIQLNCVRNFYEKRERKIRKDKDDRQ
jgi:hypothetical protein